MPPPLSSERWNISMSLRQCFGLRQTRDAVVPVASEGAERHVSEGSIRGWGGEAGLLTARRNLLPTREPCRIRVSGDVRPSWGRLDSRGGAGNDRVRRNPWQRPRSRRASLARSAPLPERHLQRVLHL